jgi:hypothetical protein
MEEGSTGPGVSDLDNTEQFFKDGTMPDGDACRPDGTLKDASEMEWLNSPSEETRNLPEVTHLSEDGYNLKRRLPCDEEESNSDSDGPPKTKVSYIFIVFRLHRSGKLTDIMGSSENRIEFLIRMMKRKVWVVNLRDREKWVFQLLHRLLNTHRCLIRVEQAREKAMQANKYKVRGRERSPAQTNGEREYMILKLKLKTRGQSRMTVRVERVWEKKRRNRFVCFPSLVTLRC